jgi:hypothetical protein
LRAQYSNPFATDGPSPGTCTEIVAQESGFTLHAGVVAQSHVRTQRERLCRYITRPPVSEERQSLTPQDHIRYDVKGFTNGRQRRQDFVTTARRTVDWSVVQFTWS